ncbi:hypothetical protein B0J13DRAFT_493741 [Dactylonectria estremocensis]|uniref:AAA+ ATPase domain-containing protein n=1 Tax=Dactylonectria estremocensis TaxID=1079267 RepID=A0A9P9FFZ5_9HYPO|nr:hypothetical protein B0J13DRAFT_493741 [Dactylonectria estremocensis]
MLSASSPISFPKSSPPPAPKRALPHSHGPPKPKARPGPFLIEDDDSDDSDEVVESLEHVAKRPMLEDPRENISELLAHETETDKNPVNGPQTDSEPSERQTTLPAWTSQLPLFSTSLLSTLAPKSYTAKTCNGKATTIKERKTSKAATYESMVAARSRTKEGRAKRSYYGIEIHELINAASSEIAVQRETRPIEPSVPIQSVEPAVSTGQKPKRTLLWTEKYRARNFMDLCGDDGTNRLVLRWLKKWDPVVFPGSAKSRPGISRRPGMNQQEEEEKPHKKILMLTGPPGLGKTTLAHVCARQAGYEVMEINASDDRSRDVVKNRIRTSLGTESVKTVGNRKDGDGPQKVAKPACVVVDEVDGVVAGSGGSGEGGFVKALIDLVLLDQKNASGAGSANQSHKKKKGDDFRLMRPLILICNDVYHPSLRPLRQSGLAEIVHVGKASVDAVVGRLKNVFEKEGIPCDKDAARKLCEAAWGMTSGIDAKRGAESTVEGDLRGVMVVGEWVARRFRSTPIYGAGRLTRQWIEQNILNDLAKGGGGGRGLGRGSVKDIVSRLFQEGGGFPKQAMDLSESKTTKHEQPKAELGFGEYQKKHAMERLRQMIDTSGEVSHIMTEIFSEYPNREFNDDLYLTKPNQAYDWMHFHDTCQTRLFADQEWELAPYLSQPVLACHHLFASPKRHIPNMGFDRRWGGDAQEDAPPPVPFSGPRADYQAFEAERQNRSQLQALQSQLPPTLMRSFRSPEAVAVEFLPYLVRLISPDVKPVVVGGSQGSTASVRKESERAMVKRASQVLAEVGIVLEKGKIESDSLVNRAPQWVYRMDPDLDVLATFETAASLLSSGAPTRYAVRQVLDQELKLTIAAREALARQARFKAGNPLGHDDDAFVDTATAAKNKILAVIAAAKQATLVKRDFFGRIIEVPPPPVLDADGEEQRARLEEKERKVWVTYHEGLNNAVRKPISFQEFMKGI